MQGLGQLTEARRLLKKHFGYSGFRPPQLRVIGPVLAGRDTLAVLPTGGGKSICFQIPALMSGGLTLVISPLISLMQDQVGALRLRGIAAGMLNRALSIDEERSTLDALKAGELRLLYTAPERVSSLGSLLPTVSLLAIDEAHCVSEWGLSFRPAYRRLGHLRLQLGKPQTLALTGSATPAVRRDIVDSLGMRHPEVVLGSFDRPNLTFEVHRARDNAHRLQSICEFIRQRDVITLLYAPTRKIVEDLTRHLRDRGVRAAPYHAGLDHDVRRNVLEAFLANELQVVVATSAFGMGIDKPDVRVVLHWGPPPTLESYYQEAGRAGRDGEPAHCVLLYCRHDIRFRYEQLRSEPKERQVAARKRLDAMVRYITARTCRRAAMLGYFGELMSACTGCDRCRRFIALPKEPSVSSSVEPDPQIMKALMAWRRRLARRTAIPESAFLDSDTIGRLASEKPRDAETLAAIEGVGAELVARRGRSLLRVLTEEPRASRVGAHHDPPLHPALYEELRRWRKALAEKAAVPAYCILTNQALHGMANVLPEDRVALARIRGVGPKTLAKHGQAILDLVSAYTANASSVEANEPAMTLT